MKRGGNVTRKKNERQFMEHVQSQTKKRKRGNQKKGRKDADKKQKEDRYSKNSPNCRNVNMQLAEAVL